MKPSSILYNYRSLVMAVSSPDSITALVDHGFRSWAMRQFRLAGVQCADPRSAPRGEHRDAVKTKLAEQRNILRTILMPEETRGVNVLVSPEKPSFSGQFCANVFIPISGKPDHYCVKFADIQWLDICSFMRDVCAGVTAPDLALSFIRDVGPKSFVR